MAIFNALDTGPNSLNQGPSSGQVPGRVVVSGGRTISWGRAAKEEQRSTIINVQAPFAIGGAAAGTRQAVRYAVQQLREMAGNPDLNPVYIQWESGNGVLTPSPYDGWYVLDEVTPLDFRFNGHVPCQVVATFVAPPAPRGLAMAFAGGALATNYNGAPQNLIAFPVGAANLESGLARTGGEGTVNAILSPVAAPVPFTPSATIANLFKGGVHVYDTISTAANPLPHDTDGLFINPNWVEVFGTDHAFVGDCVIQNGFLRLLFAQGQNSIFVCAVWNTALATPSWQTWAQQFQYLANDGSSGGVLKQYTLLRVGAEEVAIAAISSTATGKVLLATIRLQRGRYEGRIAFRPLTEATTTVRSLRVVSPTSVKISYNPGSVADLGLENTNGIPTDYGYSASLIASATYPFIFGFLYQNQPGGPPPIDNLPALDDTTSLAVNAERTYGFYAIPYGVSGTYSTANLQAEAESGTFDAGWSSVADAAASGGNAAKCVSGTVISRTARWGPTTFIPAPGSYDIGFRVKVTSNAGAGNEMQLGLWDEDTLTFVASTTFKPNQMTTGYVWYRAAIDVIPTASHHMRWLANTVATLGTDWFIDEAVMVPKTLGGDNRGPQDIWRQFIYDRSTALVVA